MSEYGVVEPPPLEERIFLVVVDDSEEMPIALHYACRRAEHTDGRVALFYVPEKADFQHWISVGDLMRKEAREAGEELLQRHSGEVQRETGKVPILFIREGDRSEELFKLMDEEPSISILVLATGTETQGPGPIISYMMNKGVRRLHVPVTVVPGTLTHEEIKAIT
jgi:nucleotide-binding universal stress UspA family protein